MFRPIPAIIRFSSESVVVVLYMIGYVTVVRSHHLWCLLLFALLREAGGCSWCALAWGVQLRCVCSLRQIYLSCTPQASSHHRSPPPCPLTIAYNNKHHKFWDLTIVTYPYQSYKAPPPYFRTKTWWWPQWAETCSYYHPLLNTILDIVVLLTDTYTYCLYTHNGDGSFQNPANS